MFLLPELSEILAWFTNNALFQNLEINFKLILTNRCDLLFKMSNDLTQKQLSLKLKQLSKQVQQTASSGALKIR